MPYFNFSTRDFHSPSLSNFPQFVYDVLSRRDSQVELYSVNLTFHRMINYYLVRNVLFCLFSHDFEQLTITCLFDWTIDFPLHVFCSHSLKYLSLSGSHGSFPREYNIVLESTWELPALTTLHLDHVAFYENNAGLFSKCANLKNLTMDKFNVEDSCKFTVNVVAPLLENLTIRDSSGKNLIDAPNLVSLLYDSAGLLQFSSDLCSLEKADLRIDPTDRRSGYKIDALLHQLHNVKFLTLNLEFIEPFISYMERISLQHSPFYNLRSLKIYPVLVPSNDEAHKKVNMSSKVINYFLDGSPTATFTLISYEEVEEEEQASLALAYESIAQNLMAKLQAKLEEEKTNIESSRTCMDRGMESHEANAHDQGTAPVEKMQLHFKRKMKQMKRYWEDVGVQIDQGKRRTRGIISDLRYIEEFLMADYIPASKRDELQSSFSSLCAEVDTVVKKILHHMSIPQTHLNDCFNELATTSLLSS